MKVSSRLRTVKEYREFYGVHLNRKALGGGKIPMGSTESEVSPEYSYSDREEIHKDSLSTNFSHRDVANSSVPGP